MQPIFFLFLLQTLAHANTHQPELFSFKSQVSERLMGCPLCLKPSSTTISLFLLSCTHTKQKVISTLHFLHQWWGHNRLLTPGPSALTKSSRQSASFPFLYFWRQNFLPALNLRCSRHFSDHGWTARPWSVRAAGWASDSCRKKKVDGRRKSTRIRRGERFMAGI